MTLAAGSLRHRIRIYTMVDAQGEEFGQNELTPVLFADRVPASVDPLTGREWLNADKQEAGISHRIRMRWMPNVVPKMQIEFDGRTFNVVSAINKEERNIELELMCLEKV